MSPISERYIHPSIQSAFRINLEGAESGGHEHPQAFKDQLIAHIEFGLTIRQAANEMGLTYGQAESIWKRREK